ncbi:protein-export chaperone SecB [Beggiatoa leptomitoformis]|uniref:Protein-export protein SecB n=1 Tax=Beggiatoa leptomitoformis TaxID=288004 RepID=A0A2N9YHS9_9GAMM|nr:protein-export chaperone SecB [Beggiatoa leptomitoformis]ALG67704.1 protein-export chaperone SecB [Beggiatoa leptomitoformis]AUI70057.1 protein-export chaperone SecB [Beggiatoa leptomitoformis]
MADENQQVQENFQIGTIYIKDVSFETTSSPDVWNAQGKLAPETEISSSINVLRQDVYEVILKINVTVKVEDSTAFIIEIQQAGVFVVQGFIPERLNYMLHSYCLNILFPYARANVADLVMRGGFPPLTLGIMNFDAMYAQRMQQLRDEAAAKSTTTATA